MQERLAEEIAQEVPDRPSSKRRKKKRGFGSVFFEKEIVPWMFLLPVLVLNLLVMLGPSAGSLYYAFTNWRGLGSAEWIGLDNFVRMLNDRFVVNALRNNIKWLALALIGPPAVALIVAALLAEITRGQRIFRAIFFLPLVVSTAVGARAWQGIYHPLFGVIAWLADHGLEFLDIRLLGNQDLALYLVFIASLWKGWGFPMVLFLAAMQQVSADLYEAAIMDGANRFQQWIHITIPSIRPTLILILVFTLIGSMLVFDFIFIMTRGGPNNTTDVLAYRMYLYAFDRFQAGYAAAIGVMLTIWAAFVTVGFTMLRRLGWEV
jgi:raffinose/stachyose/melibiose transport system permease protein